MSECKVPAVRESGEKEKEKSEILPAKQPSFADIKKSWRKALTEWSCV